LYPTCSSKDCVSLGSLLAIFIETSELADVIGIIYVYRSGIPDQIPSAVSRLLDDLADCCCFIGLSFLDPSSGSPSMSPIVRPSATVIRNFPSCSMNVPRHRYFCIFSIGSCASRVYNLCRLHTHLSAVFLFRDRCCLDRPCNAFSG